MATKKNAGKSAGSKAAKGSGPTQLAVSEGKLTAKVPTVSAGIGAPGSALQTFYGRTSPDASPGWNTLTLNNLPLNTRVITVWMTEWVPGNFSHAGAAWFSTHSVQLFNQGRNCRVRFHLQWGTNLPAGYMVIFGPG